MFQEPAPTQFDLRFRAFGIPVRVHPLFWLVTVFLALEIRSLATILIWVACVFASILVHELGHALTARRFGESPRISLYSMGGLAIYSPRDETPRRRFIVLLMGPGAGFLLYGATLAFAWIAYGIRPVDAWHFRLFEGRSFPSPMVARALDFLFQINLYWGLVNLLPIMPLDGGQISSILFSLQNRREGQRRAYILSLVVAGLGAVYFFNKDDRFMAIAAGILAFQSFQVLQVLHHQSRYGAMEEDADWWRR